MCWGYSWDVVFFLLGWRRTRKAPGSPPPEDPPEGFAYVVFAVACARVRACLLARLRARRTRPGRFPEARPGRPPGSRNIRISRLHSFLRTSNQFNFIRILKEIQ